MTSQTFHGPYFLHTIPRSTRSLAGWRVPRIASRAWKRVFGPGRRLEDRIVHLFVALLIAIQLASFLCMRYAIEAAALGSVRDELKVGSRVLERLLLHQGQQLQEAATVLSADFGLREAVATGDRATILSALESHAARFKARRMALIGLDGRVVADSSNPGSAGTLFPYADLMQRQEGLGPSIRVFDGRPHQMIVMPVLAPAKISWVVLMRAVDNAMVRDLERLVDAGVAIVVQEGASLRIVATTLGVAAHRALAEPMLAMVRDSRAEGSMQAPGMSYQALARPLDEAGGQRIHAILLRATEESVFPFRVLELTALLLTAAALALTLAGSMRIARKITSPMARLGAAAREIAHGNYEVRAGANGSDGSDEMADLSKAINTMADGMMQRDLMRSRLGRVREQRDDLARITQDLAQQATHDSLTGLANRRALELHLAGWDAEHRAVAMLMVDIDHFKDINDKHSHLVGDHVLQTVASIIRATCRPTDFAARYGGEEFLIAVTRPEPGSAAAVAERLRAAVASHPWHHVNPSLAVTVSVGVAEAREGVEASTAVRCADAALYAAKRAGRNQVSSRTGAWVTP